MPLPFDAVGQAVGAATWLVGAVAERLVGDGVAAWAARHGLDDAEVPRLRAALRRANLVLGAARAGGKKIGNEELAGPIAAVRRLAADARNLLDELDYLESHHKISDKEHDPCSSKAQSFIRFAYGFASQTSKYISSTVKINPKVSVMHKEDGPLTTKRKVERHDIMTGMKRMKLADSDNQMIPESKLEGDTVPDGTAERKLTKDDISRRITNIVDQLHGICEDVRKALKQEKLDEITRVTQNTISNSREEGACFVETKVFAREHEKNHIENCIINSEASNQKLMVLPVIGTGGVGKTTLARTIYNDPDVQAKFGIRIWIHVSVNFDVVKLTEHILECISDGRHKNLTKNFSMLQDGIKQCLNKRFLLVLDDMWEDDERRWNKLLAPLRCTEISGNVVLVTTRELSVVKMTSTVEQHINLGGLKEDVFWLFFKRCIFGEENYQGRRKLQKIGKEIVTRLKGNPLAARSVGTLLKRRLEEKYWQRISDGDEWKLQGGNDDILPALMLSYNHLPYHLQRLFSYCAVFPKGYKFHKEQLVCIWIALGFVVDERKRLEDTGSDYFDDLVDRSFFEKIEEPQEPAYYLMHDLIHDVAQSVSVDECLTVDGSAPLIVSPSLSHVSIWTDSAYKKQQNGDIERNETFEKRITAIQKDDILRSLDSVMLVGAYNETLSVMFAKILRQLQYVRVLRLSAMPFGADNLLSSIPKLIHLRYLELWSTSDAPKPLPETLCGLYHLQVLDVSHWSGLDGLPRRISNLVNLRYLIVPEESSEPLHLHSKIARVGELNFLQELKEYSVQIESGFEISQLENLNEIRGSLRIFNLENVRKKDEACCARIKDKKHLRTLSLSWGRTSANPSFPKEVLEGLQPHDRLEHLHIINYIDATPSWLGQNFSLNNLESLYLHDCTGMEILPPFNELPFLEKLSLVGMSALKEVKFDFGCGTASRGSSSSEEDITDLNGFALTELELFRCSSLTSVRLLSCMALTKLSIVDCVVLASIDGLQSLDQLKYCDIKECPCFPSAPNFETRFQGIISI
ncbi:hypothetical protein ACQ4PT_015390 [Festuca glaucescens]